MDEMQCSIAKFNNSVMTSELAERVIAEAKADAASVTPQSIGGEPDRATKCFIRLKDMHRLIGWQICVV